VCAGLSVRRPLAVEPVVRKEHCEDALFEHTTTLLVAVLGAGGLVAAALPGLAVTGGASPGTSAQQRLSRTHAQALQQARRQSGISVSQGEDADAG